MAKRVECALCTRFRQGSYGPRCSYFGKQLNYDETSCDHFNEVKITKPVQEEPPIMESEKNEKRKGCNFFDSWWWGGAAGVSFVAVLRRWIRGYNHSKYKDEYLNSSPIFFSIIFAVAAVALVISIWKFKSSTKKHKELFCIYKTSKLDAISLLLWTRLAFLVSNVLLIVFLVISLEDDYEWPLLYMLFPCCWILFISSMIITGFRFNRFEKKNLEFNDKFGFWLIGYGIVSCVILVAVLMFFVSETELSDLVYIAFVFFVVFLDSLYSFNIFRYSKETVPKLFEEWEKAHPEAHVQSESIQSSEKKKQKQELNTQSYSSQKETTEDDKQKQQSSKQSFSSRTEATRLCPYCGEVIKAGAKKCRYCHEWIEEL